MADNDVLKLGFVMNSMQDKLIVSSRADNAGHLSNSSLVVSTNPSILEKIGNKPGLLYVRASSRKPWRIISKVVSTSVCSEVSIPIIGQATLSRGFYLALP